MKIIRTDSPEFKPIRDHLLNRGITYGKTIESSVKKIIEDVRANGDKALIKYTRRFDGLSLTSSTMRIDRKAIGEAYSKVKGDDVRDLEYAARRIGEFHQRQAVLAFFASHSACIERSENNAGTVRSENNASDASETEKVSGWHYRKDGVLLGQMVTPIEKVGLYVPGGKALYPSSVLMSAIPAKIAGVKDLMICTPTPHGEINPYILVAADIAGVDEIYTVGGAQAVAAMACGTETIPRVDKIVGPGNIYVAIAKKILYGQVDIDMIAGPSEILIVADDSADPSFLSMDLLSQAEHDEEAVAILITPSETLAQRVSESIRSDMRRVSRRKVIEHSLRDHGLIIVTRDMKEALDLANDIAAEHLSLQVSKPMELLKGIKNAGAIFLGSYTPQTMGDYVAGPNHTLPTGGTARFFSPLSVDDFVKKSSLIMYNKTALKRDGGAASRLALIEGLDAHSEAVKIRMGGREEEK